MSRSGYSDNCENLELYRQTVANAIRGRRGQAFLREMLAALDAMPEKRLIRDELITEAGEVCAIGAVCKARKLDVSNIDYEDPERVAKLVGIATCLAAEIEYENDEAYWSRTGAYPETDEDRWQRMRAWITSNLVEPS